MNTLLANDAENSRRNIQIVRYAVIPLSHQSGLIEWVPDCDTLHALIRDYRWGVLDRSQQCKRCDTLSLLLCRMPHCVASAVSHATRWTTCWVIGCVARLTFVASVVFDRCGTTNL